MSQVLHDKDFEMTDDLPFNRDEERFKVGDRVRCVKKEWEHSYPNVMEIVAAPGSGDYAKVAVRIAPDDRTPVHSWPTGSLALAFDESDPVAVQTQKWIEFFNK